MGAFCRDFLLKVDTNLRSTLMSGCRPLGAARLTESSGSRAVQEARWTGRAGAVLLRCRQPWQSAMSVNSPHARVRLEDMRYHESVLRCSGERSAPSVDPLVGGMRHSRHAPCSIDTVGAPSDDPPPLSRTQWYSYEWLRAGGIARARRARAAADPVLRPCREATVSRRVVCRPFSRGRRARGGQEVRRSAGGTG